MARPALEIEDRTPLAGSSIDIPARIGWLLRSWRVQAGLDVRTMAASLTAVGYACSSAKLSRLEVGGVRSGAAQAAYELALGLPRGAIRTPIEILCRTFSYRPVDVEPVRPVDSLAAFSSACAAIEGQPDGGDWLLFAEYHASSSFGLPISAITPLVERLASEMPRATGLAYANRYEALARLRCSSYGDVVAQTIQGMVEGRGAQRTPDLISVVTESPTAELLAWCASLLDHPSSSVARAAGLGIQNLRTVGGIGIDAWLEVAPVFAAACNRHADDRERISALADTLAACAPQFRAAVRDRLVLPLPDGRRPADWTSGRRNRHHALCLDLADGVADSLPGASILARVLFEILYDFRAAIVVTSAFLLTASPYAGRARSLMHDLALTSEDETTRHGAASAFANLMLPFDDVDPRPWLESADPVTNRAGLTIAGFAGYQLAPDELDRLINDADTATRECAMFSAGMSQHPHLRVLAEAADNTAADGAAWWLTHGGRITT